MNEKMQIPNATDSVVTAMELLGNKIKEAVKIIARSNVSIAEAINMLQITIDQNGRLMDE